MLKSAYLGPSLDQSRDNVELLLGTEIVEAPVRPHDTASTLLEVDSGKPRDMVSAHMGGVPLPGAANNRGVKRRRQHAPSVLVRQRGEKFVEQAKAICIEEKQKLRAAASQDPKVF